MKLFSLLAFLLCSFVTAAAPLLHHPKNPDEVPPAFFIRPYTQCQYYFYKKQEGTLGVKFPYTLTDGNTSASYIFSSSKQNLTGSGKFSYTFPGLEIGYGRFSVEANMNIVTGPVFSWTDNFYFGVNFRPPFPRLFFEKSRIKTAGLLFPALSNNPWHLAVHLGVEYYHPLYELGEINAGSSHFLAAGNSLPALDTAITGTGKVNVYFQQNTISIMPAFGLTYDGVKGLLHIGMRIAPLIMLSQEGGLRFRYRNSQHQLAYLPGGYNLHYIPVDAATIETTYNGERISATPFSLKGFMISFSVGLTFGQ
jgi:hypothetical protein